ncbi:hypothetical protein CEUSTIGMA_g8155.t1 [Chlamydomonas eustigma]|uniref:Uncharacterized protein n=1 Tax=Chlamydomonas eustigma TaxID=1157962 RepID=A0A250XD88_9CHLO|nr:hypothetical protein CEUSTIGMA_g8155.t1 [Chlamydomonas eustigma]|eukprot:GAX80720.1 hypothetical protein CEUSTIGMA_g8155.t1 [Chlamydomonas eustigma]
MFGRVIHIIQLGRIFIEGVAGRGMQPQPFMMGMMNGMQPMMPDMSGMMNMGPMMGGMLAPRPPGMPPNGFDPMPNMMGAPGQLMQGPMQGTMQPMMMSAGPRPPGVPFDPKFGMAGVSQGTGGIRPPPPRQDQQQRQDHSSSGRTNVPMRGRYGAIIPPGSAGPLISSRTDHASNDYCQHFVDTGQRPQNFLLDSTVIDERYSEYPQMRELMHLKEAHIAKHATPPYYLRADLRALKLSVETFGTKFDSILVDPPWEEYVRRAPGLLKDPEYWAWKEIMALEIENIADTPSFIFLWCGSAEGLEAGRHCLNKWGFRRCEDICWVKTNKEHPNKKLSAVHQELNSVLVHTKEHCLMGIKGNVRRGLDGQVIHANCDTDIIVGEEPPLGSTAKPEEMYGIIERFCNGRRRLELFGEEHNIRPGWVTVGRSLPTSNFNPAVYSSHFKYHDGTPYTENRNPNGKLPLVSPNLLPMHEGIEDLRPKSPPQGSGRK